MALGLFATSIACLLSHESYRLPRVCIRQVSCDQCPAANLREHTPSVCARRRLAGCPGCSASTASQDWQASLYLCLLVHGRAQHRCIRGMARRHTPLVSATGRGPTRRSCGLATTARDDGAASVVLLHHVTGANCRLLRLNLNVRLHHIRTLRICRSDSTRYGNVNGYMRGQGRTRMKACGKNGEPAMITSPKDAEGAFGRRLPAWSQSSRITVADRFLSIKRMPP